MKWKNKRSEIFGFVHLANSSEQERRMITIKYYTVVTSDGSQNKAGRYSRKLKQYCQVLLLRTSDRLWEFFFNF